MSLNFSKSDTQNHHTMDSNCIICSFQVDNHYMSTIRCINCKKAQHRKCFGTKLNRPTWSSLRNNWTCVNCSLTPAAIPASPIPPNNLPFANHVISPPSSPSSSPRHINLPTRPIIHLANQLCKKGFAFCHLNINGIKKRFDELCHFLKFQSNIALFAVSETKLNSRHDPIQCYQIQNFNLFRYDQIKEGGGLAIFVHHSIAATEIPVPIKLPKHMEVSILKLHIRTGIAPILVITVYTPPDQSKVEFTKALGSLLAFVADLNLEFILLGDLNINLLVRNAHTFSQFKLKKEFHMAQLMSGPTRVTKTSATLIDHMYVSHPLLDPSFGHEHLFSSDHDKVARKKKQKNA